jgi:hypothetical protein
MYLTNSQVSVKNLDNFIKLEVAISRVRVYDAPPGTVRDTEFRASFFCHFKKLRCKSLLIVNVTFKSQILKSIFYSRQSHVNQNRRKR